MFKLVCGNSPKKEGIALKDGSWDMKKFEEHISRCEVCRGFAGKLAKQLRRELKGGPQDNASDN